MPESKLHEYQETAEELRVELDAQIPAELIDSEPIIVGDTHEGAQHGPGGEPWSPAWWQVRQKLWPIDQPGNSEQAAQALHDYLEKQGWHYSRTRTGTDNTAFAEGYRRTDDAGEQWYVQVTWVKTVPDRVERLAILIVSPTTVLGTDPPERERTGPDNG